MGFHSRLPCLPTEGPLPQLPGCFNVPLVSCSSRAHSLGSDVLGKGRGGARWVSPALALLCSPEADFRPGSAGGAARSRSPCWTTTWPSSSSSWLWELSSGLLGWEPERQEVSAPRVWVGASQQPGHWAGDRKRGLK